MLNSRMVLGPQLTEAVRRGSVVSMFEGMTNKGEGTKERDSQIITAEE